MPLWHAHQSCEVSFLNCTVQSRCVQTPLNAAELEDGGRIEAQRAGAAGDDALRGGFAARRRNQEARDRVRDRHGRRHKPHGEERVEEHAPIEV